MPTTTYPIVDGRRTIKYSGSNSSDIISAVGGDCSLVSESGGTLVLNSSSTNWTIHTNDQVVYWQHMIVNVFDQSTFDFFFAIDALASDLTAINSSITTLTSQVNSLAAGSTSSARSVGLKESPTLLFSQSTTVAVDIIPAMPDTSYTPVAQLVAPSTALGSLSITSVSVVDADTVNVVVQNSGLVSLSGVHILVVAKK